MCDFLEHPCHNLLRLLRHDALRVPLPPPAIPHQPFAPLRDEMEIGAVGG